MMKTAYQRSHTEPRKGGTVVPPADFQSVRPKSPIDTAFSAIFPHGHPQTHAHRHTLARTQLTLLFTPMRIHIFIHQKTKKHGKFEANFGQNRPRHSSED